MRGDGRLPFTLFKWKRDPLARLRGPQHPVVVKINCVAEEHICTFRYKAHLRAVKGCH